MQKCYQTGKLRKFCRKISKSVNWQKKLWKDSFEDDFIHGFHGNYFSIKKDPTEYNFWVGRKKEDNYSSFYIAFENSKLKRNISGYIEKLEYRTDTVEECWAYKKIDYKKKIVIQELNLLIIDLITS